MFLLRSAGQTVLAEALKTCTSIEQLTKLPVTPKTLDVLLEAGYLGTDDWEDLPIYWIPNNISFKS